MAAEGLVVEFSLEIEGTNIEGTMVLEGVGMVGVAAISFEAIANDEGAANGFGGKESFGGAGILTAMTFGTFFGTDLITASF